MEDSQNTAQTKEDKIKQKAHDLGFLSCGIAKADSLSDFTPYLDHYTTTGRNADLGYMERNREKRLDPRLLVEGCKSIISVVINYYHPEKQTDPEAPVVSKYAYGKDYHLVVKEKLFSLMEYINANIAQCSGRAFVDSAPVVDKLWAQRAGLGWIGKNTLLITPQHGSFVFIGELLIDVDLEPDQAFTKNLCGTCTKCIDACPTNALIEAGKIDAGKCISYFTTANKGDVIDPSLKGKFNNQVFGCDICQDVCPWNSKATAHQIAEFLPKKELMQMSKEEWTNISQEQFSSLFKDTAIKQAKYKGLLRNIRFLSNDKSF